MADKQEQKSGGRPQSSSPPQDSSRRHDPQRDSPGSKRRLPSHLSESQNMSSLSPLRRRDASSPLTEHGGSAQLSPPAPLQLGQRSSASCNDPSITSGHQQNGTPSGCGITRPEGGSSGHKMVPASPVNSHAGDSLAPDNAKRSFQGNRRSRQPERDRGIRKNRKKQNRKG